MSTHEESLSAGYSRGISPQGKGCDSPCWESTGVKVSAAAPNWVLAVALASTALMSALMEAPPLPSTATPLETRSFVTAAAGGHTHTACITSLVSHHLPLACMLLSTRDQAVCSCCCRRAHADGGQHRLSSSPACMHAPSLCVFLVMFAMSSMAAVASRVSAGQTAPAGPAATPLGATCMAATSACSCSTCVQPTHGCVS